MRIADSVRSERMANISKGPFGNTSEVGPLRAHDTHFGENLARGPSNDW